ncbi:MAG: methyl-accepting chemotaxis protein [Gammaproteobacteria bacterium]|nr:methyl-accepting chemotaxis protein [Gammaproteobacteria bacterium]
MKQWSERLSRSAIWWLPALCALMFFASVYLLVQQHSIGSDLRVSNPALRSANSTAADYKQDFKALGEMAITLAGWLEQGSSTQNFAPKAQLMASFVAQISADPTQLSSTFWQQFSSRLSELEQHVRVGEITTPESQAMVATIRQEYAALRQVWESDHGAIASGSDRIGSRAETAAFAADGVGWVDQLHRSQNRFTRWLWMLAILSALSTLLSWLLALRYDLRADATKNRFLLGQTSGQNADNPTNSDQLAILQLLDEMTPLASGDLTVTATVSEAMTGALADAFNYSVLELRRLVSELSSSADEINAAIENTRQASRKMASAGSVQSREVMRSSNYLNAMSGAMAQLSAHAAEAATITEDSVEQAQAADHAAAMSSDALTTIKIQADATSDAMQRLVSSTQTIQARVRDISSVAERTDLLALNTTIQAAANTDVGTTGPYVRLSDEVSTLADVLGQAARDIVHLVDTIQLDANNTLDCMRHTQQALQIGTARVADVSHALVSIDQTSKDLHEHVTTMAGKALKQAGVVKQLSANMGVINELTRDTAEGLNSSATEIDALHDLSIRLRRSVAGFRLPETSADHLAEANRVVDTRSSKAHS